MAVEVFGIVYGTVRTDYFPNFSGEFSATSTPSAARVTQFIKRSAVELAGALRLKGLTAAGIAADTASEAYTWCEETVCLGAAVRVAKVMTGFNPDVAKQLAAELKERLDALKENGAEAIGLGATVADSTDEPMGPTSHVDELDLDVGEDDGNESELIPVLRRDDQL